MSDWNYKSNKNWYSVPPQVDWDEVAGVSIDRDQNLILFARGKTPVIVVDKKGEYINSFAHKDFSRPHSVRVDDKNYIWFVDDGDHTVKKYDINGNKLMTIGIPDSPSPIHSGIPFNRCTDIAIDYLSDSIFISDGYGNSSIHKYSIDGEFIKSWGSPGTDQSEFNIVHNIALDSNSYLYVADRENHRIQIFDTNGVYVDQMINMHRPCALYIDNDFLYVGELGYGMSVNQNVPNIGPRISIYDLSNKKLLMRWGEGFGDKPDQLYAPHSIVVDNNNNIYLGEVSKTNMRNIGLDDIEYKGVRKLEYYN